MGILWDAVLTLLSALGLVLLGGLIFGRLLHPMAGPDVWAMIPARGAGETVEQNLRALMWLRSLGLLRCQIVVADRGLTREGRELVLCLAARWDGVVLWPAGHLEELL